MEMEATPSGRLWVDIFRELSYSSHVMPLKTEYPRTKAKSKMVTHNPTTVLDSLENVIEPKHHRKPKNLREAAFGRMVNHRNESQSTTVNF